MRPFQIPPSEIIPILKAYKIASASCGAGIMRKLPLLLLLVCNAVSAHAKKLSVQHFDQVLAQDHGKPDADLAKELADFELTERVSAAMLARWQAVIAGPVSAIQ